MLSVPSSRAEQLTFQKRAHDTRLNDLKTKLKTEFNQKEFAKWSNKSMGIESNYQIKQKLAKFRSEANATLNSRRKKLSALLEDEDRFFKDEILAAQQTPQQIRQRMIQRVKQLKEEKQARRQDQVSGKLDKRFQQNADELRKVDQELKELRTAYQRNIQMVERQNQLKNQYEEEVLFAELNKRDILKKQEAQKLKRQIYNEKVEERNAILAIQKDIKKKKEQEEKNLDSKQKQMLKQEWQRQTELSKLKDKHSIEKQKQVNRILMQQNQRIKKDKQDKIKAQKLADREMIERIVLKQRQLSEYEKQLKSKEREESKKALQGFRNKHLQLEAYQKELDRLIEVERLKKEQRQQQEWEKREKARVNLLYQVFDDRQRKVKEHKSEKENQIRSKEEDRLEIQKRIKQFEEERERKKRQEFQRNRIEQSNILKEIALKEEKRRIIMLDLKKEDRQMENARLQYNQKIEERKQIGKQTLEVFKQTNRLF